MPFAKNNTMSKKMPHGKRAQIYADAADLAALKLIGGTVSEGIRDTLAHFRAGIVSDLDGTIIPYANNNTEATTINPDLVALWQSCGISRIKIATNQGGINFADGLNKYPTAEMVAKRLAFAVSALAEAGIEVTEICAATYHPKATPEMAWWSAIELESKVEKVSNVSISANFGPEYRKPEIMMFVKLGATLYFGDSDEDAAAASAAGCKFARVERF